MGHSSRSRFGLKLVSKLADEAGQKCGTIAGRWAGSAIGSFGGPGTACLGYLAGGYVGGLVGYVGASAIADRIFDCAGLSMVLPDEMLFKYNSQINVSVCIAALDTTFYSLCSDDIDKPVDDVIISGPIIEDNAINYLPYDSIGFHHNSIMYSINHNRDTYILNGEPNIEKIYDDIISYLKGGGYDVGAFEIDATVRNSMIECIKWFGYLAYNEYYKKGISINEYVDAQCKYMQTTCLLTTDEILLYKNFDVEIVKKCDELSIEEIDNYAIELNNLIMTADVSPELRVDMALAAQAAINSALCWNQE